MRYTVLKDRNGNPLNPATSSTAVKHTDGKNLANYIEILKKLLALNNINGDIDLTPSYDNPTFTGIAKATANTEYSTPQLRNISAGTEDLTAGTSELESGSLYFVYE